MQQVDKLSCVFLLHNMMTTHCVTKIPNLSMCYSYIQHVLQPTAKIEVVFQMQDITPCIERQIE